MTEHAPTTTSNSESSDSEAANRNSEVAETSEDEHAAAVAGLEQRAEELGLSPEETDEAIKAYEASLEDDPKAAEEIEDKIEEEVSDQLSVDDLLNDPVDFMNRMSEKVALEGTNPFEEGLEASLAKLAEDIEGADGLIESMKGLGEAFGHFMEMLKDAIVLLGEILMSLEEREKLETQEEKDELVRKIQQKIDEFGRKYGGL